MAAVTPVKALYYPHLQFGSVRWLRSALLYWEGVLRLLPKGFMPFDPPEVHELVSAGLVENITPDEYLRRTAEAFGARLETLLRQPGGLPCTDPYADPLVHVSMFDPDLLQDLRRRGIATTAGDWVKLPPEIATLYKVIFANSVGRALNAAPATDETVCGAPVYFAYRKLALDPTRRAPPDGYACARMLDPFPAIEQADTLTTDQLLKVRAASSTQRRLFRETIQKRVGQLADLPSEQAIESHIDDFTREIRTEIDAQRGASRASTLRDTWRLILISTPASVGAAVGIAGSMPLVAAAGVVGTLGLGVADVYGRIKQRRHAGHYLLVLESALRSRRLGVFTAAGREPRPPTGPGAFGRPSRA
jgi:hypothetical protein